MLEILWCIGYCGRHWHTQQENPRALELWSKAILQGASRFCQAPGPYCIWSSSSCSGYYEIHHVIRLRRHSGNTSHNGNGKLRTGLGRSKEQKHHLQAPSHFHVSYLCAAHTYITPMVPYDPLTKEEKYSAHSHKSEIVLVLVKRGLLLYFACAHR